MKTVILGLSASPCYLGSPGQIDYSEREELGGLGKEGEGEDETEIAVLKEDAAVMSGFHSWRREERERERMVGGKVRKLQG